MKKQVFAPATKADHLEVINTVLSRFYGHGTKVSGRVERLPLYQLAHLAEVVRLWSNDPLADSVMVLEEHIRASF